MIGDRPRQPIDAKRRRLGAPTWDAGHAALEQDERAERTHPAAPVNAGARPDRVDRSPPATTTEDSPSARIVQPPQCSPDPLARIPTVGDEVAVIDVTGEPGLALVIAVQRPRSSESAISIHLFRPLLFRVSGFLDSDRTGTRRNPWRWAS